MTFLSSSLAESHSKSDNGKNNLVVVELFTSQGCNACPPADNILAELSKGEDILALSYSVDYWNFMGWKDTLARPDCTLRQKEYNRFLGKNGVYTPQMIIQGARDLVGSRGKLAQAMIDEVQNRPSRYPAPNIIFETIKTSDGDMINLEIAAVKDKPQATIWIIGYNYLEKVNIKNGELAGQSREYHNVVHAIKRIGSWMGQEIKLTLSSADIGGKKYDSYAVLVQDKEVGPIITAAKLSR